MADVILELLNLMRVRGTAYISKTLAAPWGVYIDHHPDLARFHLVLGGSAWMSVPGATEPEKLNTGDIAIIPNGRAHTYTDTAERRPLENSSFPSFAPEPYFVPYNAASIETHLLCGYFRISPNTPPAILNRLPDLLVARGNREPNLTQFDLIVKLAQNELSKKGAPSQIILNRLTEMLCVIALQDWLEDAVTRDEGLQALADPKTKLVLDAVHTDPAHAWTVAGMAKISGQSRTAFAAHFKQATGLSPIHYVRRWRIRNACKMLEATGSSIDEIAFKSGYEDTNAFNRAFRREMGSSPGVYRRLAQN